MKNGYQKALIAGAIAGAVGTLGFIAAAYVLGISGVVEPPFGSREAWIPSMYMWVGLAHLSLDVIWGAIFGLFFASLYGWIPGKGVVKGLYYGLFIWLIRNVAAGSSFALTMLKHNEAIIFIFCGFFLWIVYGPVIGYLYKK